MNQRLKRWWQGITEQIGPLGKVAILLVVVGLVMLVVSLTAPSFRGSPLLGILGGSILGAGLRAFVGSATGREDNHHESAREANLARKRETYGPLYAEVKTLRRALSGAEAGVAPPPIWIDTGVAVKRAGVSYITALASAPTLKCWPEFKQDYRDTDFTPAAQTRLQALQISADAYNNAIEAARVAAIPILAETIEAAVFDLRKSDRYKQWRQRQAEREAQQLPLGHAPKMEDDWYGYLDNTEAQFAKPIGQTLGRNLATIWLGNWPQSYPSDAPGWLMTGHTDQAAQDVYRTHHLVHLVCVQGCVGFGGTYRRVVANNRSRQEKLPYSLTWPVVTTWRQDGHNTRLEEAAPYTCNSSFNAPGNVGGKWSTAPGYILPC